MRDVYQCADNDTARRCPKKKLPARNQKEFLRRPHNSYREKVWFETTSPRQGSFSPSTAYASPAPDKNNGFFVPRLLLSMVWIGFRPLPCFQKHDFPVRESCVTARPDI